ncbi:MAG: hypothetical protein HYX32_02035 [Actinobacteria bacterium]|nr:hypothetical protein [Actinomycetota bacterium]
MRSETAAPSWSWKPIALIAVAAGAVSAYSIVLHGPALSDDSIAYLAIATRWRTRGELGYWLEPATSTWPPVYPMWLGVLGWLGDPVTLGGYAQSILHGLTVAVVGVLASELTPRRVLRYGVTLVVAFSPWMLDSAGHLWSETMFDLLALAAILLLVRAVRSRARMLPFLGASLVVVWIAFLTRYLGVVLIPSGALVLLLRAPAARATRLALAAGYLAVGLSVPLMVGLVNLGRTGNAFGPRHSSTVGIVENARDGLASISLLTFNVITVLGGIAVVVLIGFGWWLHRRDGAEVTPLALTGFAVFYVVALIGLRSVSAFDRVAYRLMLPAYAPLLLLGIWSVDAMLSAMSRSVYRRVVYAFGVALAWWTVVNGATLVQLLHDQGGGYTAVSEVAARNSFRLDLVASPCKVYSNAPFPLSLTSIESEYAPRITERWSNDRRDDLPDFRQSVRSGEVCLVWVHGAPSEEYYTPQDLQASFTLELVDESSFASVFRVKEKQ